ncbi:MAG TPA: aminotransferase class I/II-fold pyridoxal phosphate-dependent enzyme [Acetobacteraceae bacterium]|nr:aminotransferase class I/II-fold pyridoxal phosphate-dependent enzyme [Acetobacteraceae bacterium]
MQIQISLLLDRARPETLTAQIVGQMRDAIRLGRITPGARLPSSRRLSEQLGIGRNTVTRAYETLLMECYVESRPASGIFATLPPLDLRPTLAPSAIGNAVSRYRMRGVMPSTPAPLSARTGAANIPHGPAPVRNRLSFDFAPGRPDQALFPLKAWRRLLRACLAQGAAAALAQPVDPFGLAALRSAIATHLASARAIVAEPGQIVITSGTAEGIALAARLLLRPGSIAAMEMPGYRPAAVAFEAAGAELAGVAVDNEGVIPAELPPAPAALLYLTPAHQYPTGLVLSQARAGLVIGWARRSGCVIVEDDCGADFRYEGVVAPALAAAAPDCTIHLGTFSQSVGAGLRLGYMVVPPALVDSVRVAKALLNSGSPWLEQAAMAEFIRGGGFVSHVLRMRTAYRERRDHLLAALQRHFGDVEISGDAGGLHVFWHLPAGVPDAATVEALGRRARVGVYSLSSGNVCDPSAGVLSRRGIMLGYAAQAPKQIEQGIARLSDAVDDALDGHRIEFGDLLAWRPSVSGAAPGPVVRRGGKPAPWFRQKPALPVPLPRRAESRAMTGEGAGEPMPVVTGLYRYPVKGMSPQPIDTVRVQAGKPFPFDRVFALARPGTAMNAAEPKWAKKGLFVMLMLDEGLATVRTHLDEATLQLTVLDGDRPMLAADLADADGRAQVEAFFHRLVPSLAAPPGVVRARDGHFMDKPDNVVSLINLSTVRSLEAQWGLEIDPLRFRANIYIDGAAPWEEFDWIGNDIRVGEAVFWVDRRNGRCGATNVNPATGQRDRDIPGSLRKAFGHKDLGVYLVARTDADLSVGDALQRPRGAVARASVQKDAGVSVGARTFICRGCYYIYDEAQGAPTTGIAPGTRLSGLPTGWRCPDCGSEKALFRPHGVDGGIGKPLILTE